MTDEVAEALAELSEYLKLDGQRGRSAAYSRASNAVLRVNYIPPNPAKIDGIGSSVRDDIAEFQQTGTIERLEELREKHSYYEEFRAVEGIGPVTARRLGEAGIETLEELEDAISDNSILEVDGIGEKTAENIRNNI